MRQIVFESTAYLREIQTPADRTFTVLVEPLVGERVNFRNIGTHYSIIVGPGPVLPLAAKVRRPVGSSVMPSKLA